MGYLKSGAAVLQKLKQIKMETAKNYEQLLKDMELIIENFDFEKVAAYMLITNWKWYDTSNDGQIPNITRLRIAARTALFMAIDSPHPSTNTGSGGFTAYKFPWGLKLSFEPFNYSSF